MQGSSEQRFLPLSKPGPPGPSRHVSYRHPTRDYLVEVKFTRIIFYCLQIETQPGLRHRRVTALMSELPLAMAFTSVAFGYSTYL